MQIEKLEGQNFVMHVTPCIMKIIGFIGSVFIFAASIKPVDADTNIASWLVLFGMNDPSQALVSSAADDVIFWIGIVLAAIAFAEWLWRKSKKPETVALTEPEAWGQLAREIFEVVSPRVEGEEAILARLDQLDTKFKARLAIALSEIKHARIPIPDNISSRCVNTFCWEDAAKFLLNSKNQM